MNSDFSYFASKCFNLTSKNRSKSRTCWSVSLSVQYLMQSHNWIDFGDFFPFFCKFLTRHINKKRMTTCKSVLTPTTKEPKICHVLATTSAFNLKLCLMLWTVVGGRVGYQAWQEFCCVWLELVCHECLGQSGIWTRFDGEL